MLRQVNHKQHQLSFLNSFKRHKKEQIFIKKFQTFVPCLARTTRMFVLLLQSPSKSHQPSLDDTRGTLTDIWCPSLYYNCKIIFSIQSKCRSYMHVACTDSQMTDLHNTFFVFVYRYITICQN